MFESYLKKKYLEAKLLSKKKKKKIAFLIGNTTKIEKSNFYFTPIRLTEKLIIFGIVVFDEKLVIKACKLLDGKIDLIFDAEKRFFQKKRSSRNIERRVREI